MTYLYPLYTVALLVGLILVFRSQIGRVFSPSRKRAKSREDIPRTTSKSHHILVALNKWVTERGASNSQRFLQGQLRR